MMLSSNRRRQRSELRPHPKEEAMSHALATVPHPKEEAMSHALATVLHRGRKAASNIMAACLASSREARRETDRFEVRSASPGRSSDN